MRLLVAVLCALNALTAGVRERKMDIVPTIKEDKKMKFTKQTPPQENRFSPKGTFDAKTSYHVWEPKKSFGDRVRGAAAKLNSCIGACSKGRKGPLERVSGGQVVVPASYRRRSRL
ncbi:hypothetical protein LEN26_017738 [Aphanomyces euteiches]|nr:hypothetical protein LEN26_017738 [Aphanomyces euteiches]KAH9104154.1 hypothetical protein AeMF1_019671 [Aphanomyces euteiches]